MKMLIIAIAAAAMMAGAARADYRSEYKAYLAALERQDVVEALKRGEAAWRAAEAELGDHGTTAILAYNYAKQLGSLNPKTSLAPYARALDLTRKGVGSLDVNALEFEVAVVSLEADPNNPRTAAALAERLGGEQNAAAIDLDIAARAQISLALHFLNKDDLDSARAYADRGLDIVHTDELADSRVLARALIYGGIARVADIRRTEQTIAEAAARFLESFTLFPPQKDIDRFDRLLALAMAWDGSARAVANSYGGQKTQRAGSRIKGGEDLGAGLDAAYSAAGETESYRWADRAADACALEWAKRKPPSFPIESLNKGVVGSVIVGYDVNESGVERAIVLADMHGSSFGEGAVKATQSWRLAKPPSPECKKNHITVFSYAID